MRKIVASDLSSEMPSDRVPPGRHHFEGVFRIPVLGWRFAVTAKSPDKAPAAAAPAVLAISAPGLAWAAIAALATVVARPPPWVVPGAAVLFAGTMTGLTCLALWLRQHKQPRSRDLSQLEGNPTPRGDVLVEEQQVHGIEVKAGQQSVVAVTCTSSPWSLPGLGMAFLMTAAAALVPASAFLGLARLIPVSAAQAMTAIVLAFVSAAACGIVMMIRIEQLEPGAGYPPRPGLDDGSPPNAPPGSPSEHRAN